MRCLQETVSFKYTAAPRNWFEFIDLSRFRYTIGTFPAVAPPRPFSNKGVGLMKRLLGVSVMGAFLATALPAFAQTQPQTQTASSTETRPATASVSGDTGLWFVPTAEVLPHKKWSMSFYRENQDYGQGFTDVTKFPLSFGIGISHRVELFASLVTVTRIDRDTRPLFFE